METANEVNAIVDAARKPEIYDLPGQRKLVLLPEKFKIEQIDLRTYLPAPERKTGTVTLTDADSFVAYLVDQASLASCRIYINADYQKGTVSFTAVINDHNDNPQWKDFRAIYAPAFSPEWNTWGSKNAKPMSQAEFASFLEDNIKDIATVENRPSGAQMLEMALNFESRQEANIKSAIRLQSGTVAIDYTDKEDDATVKRMEVFQRFTLGVAPFFNGQAYPLDARLKYRINAGKLSFWYELIRPDLVLQDAANGLITTIKEKSGFSMFFGTP